MLVCSALFLIGYCLGVIASEDFYRFEIKLELLPMVALCAIGLGLSWGMSWQSLLAGALVWFIPTLIYQRLRPAALGQGDIWLFGTAGLVFGVEYSAVGAMLFGLFCVATAWRYARIRGKAFGRSLFPAAVPMVLALIMVLQWRVLSSLGWGVPHDLLAYGVLLLVPAGALFGIFIDKARMSLSGGPAQ